MQHNPNKEWDNLLKNKFENAEITPSVNLWKNIEGALPPEKQSILPIYWWAAASLVLVCSALLVSQKVENWSFKGGKYKPNIALQNKQYKARVKTHTFFTLKPVYKNPTVMVFAPAKKIKPKIIYKNIKPTNQKNSRVVVELALNSKLNNLHVLQKTDELIITDSVMNTNILQQNKNNLSFIKDSIMVLTSTNAQVYTPKKSIKNVGDFVNFIVSKIDKRNKKIIKFNTDESGNSSITALNIGLIQLNSKKYYNN